MKSVETITFPLFFLASNTARARAYLHVLAIEGILPTHSFLLSSTNAPQASLAPIPTDLFDNVTPLHESLSKLSVPVTHFTHTDINRKDVTTCLNSFPPGIVIFAPASGLIAKAELFATGHQFLHVHPGRLPDFRGSTPMYYSILAEGKLTATAIFLAPQIDTGPILASRDFELPDDLSSIDSIYDPYIRALLLSDVLKARCQGRDTSPILQKGSGVTYNVIHPLLKHLALLSDPANPSL